jgi:hypothetical protein
LSEGLRGSHRLDPTGFTDSTWDDAACPHASGVCSNVAGAVGVRPCGGISGTSYCYNLVADNPSGMACCSTSSNL